MVMSLFTFTVSEFKMLGEYIFSVDFLYLVNISPKFLSC